MELANHQELVIRQTREMLEVFTGFETANKYRVLNAEGEEIMYAYEESGMLSRQFMGRNRPLSLHVLDNDGTPVLSANRKFFWFFSHLNVEDGNGAPIGSLKRKWGGLKRKFAVLDAEGEQVAGLNGGIFRPFTFTLNDAQGGELGRIVKEWGGFMREGFTDADNFRVHFGEAGQGELIRLLLLASAFAVDLDFFEAKGSRHGAG